MIFQKYTLAERNVVHVIIYGGIEAKSLQGNMMLMWLSRMKKAAPKRATL